MSTSISSAEQTDSVAIRLLFLGGSLITGSLLYLGCIWPSAFTLFAIAALPSPILFLVGVARPSFVHSHRFLKVYLVGCCVASGLAWVYEVWWLSRVK
jgi:hypothetical protein